MDGLIDFSRKMLVEGIHDLGLVEGIRYPLYFFLILFSSFIGLIFISRFLASKSKFFSALSQGVVNSFYSKKWLVWVIATLNLLVSVLTIFFPAGIVSIAFVGDLLPWLVGMMASVFFVIDFLFSKEDSNPNKVAQFVSRFSTVIGFVILIVMVIHFIFPTVVIL